MWKVLVTYFHQRAPILRAAVLAGKINMFSPVSRIPAARQACRNALAAFLRPPSLSGNGLRALAHALRVYPDAVIVDMVLIYRLDKLRSSTKWLNNTSLKTTRTC